MLTTSKLFDFTLQHSHKPQEGLFKKNKFTSNFVSPLSSYQSELHSNTVELEKKYPSADREYIKQLLEELDNNLEMVSEILEQQSNASKSKINKREETKKKSALMEDQNSGSDSNSESGCERKQQKLILNKITDISVLKSSILKLYTKLTKEQKEKESLEKKVAQLQKENEHLKISNKQLMNESMSQNQNLFENLDIC